MATVTSDGKIASSGKGKQGLQLAWTKYNSWCRNSAPNLAARVKSARTGR